MLAPLIFWTAVAIVVYTYAGYPVVLSLLRRAFHRPARRAPVFPSVTLLIPAYNEAGVMERKMRNSLALDYPVEQLEILVASDGSVDGTAAIAERFTEGGRVRVLSFAYNRGKMATLNASVPYARGEIVVFSDTAAILRPDALRRLVESFADPAVGAVSGRYAVINPGDVSSGASEDFYWRYETQLKILESELGSTLGAHGHLYAIRRELYPYPPPNTINDDYVVPISVIAKGYRTVYEPAALVYEEAREMTGFGRRIRIMAGNIQQLREFLGLLRPFRPLPVFFFVSHKLMRLLVPFAMVTALISNVALLGTPIWTAVFGAQALFYALAFSGLVFRLRPKVLMLPFYFSMINAAAFFGLYHACTRRRSLAWD
ncbi:MAG TPA: glycosyltransferase family 2 protein [Bryobacteraceae bacterium]|nr:glycosyltransferase family 2 protein [Bryobacteraceae bacterium]